MTNAITAQRCFILSMWRLFDRFNNDFLFLVFVQRSPVHSITTLSPSLFSCCLFLCVPYILLYYFAFFVRYLPCVWWSNFYLPLTLHFHTAHSIPLFFLYFIIKTFFCLFILPSPLPFFSSTGLHFICIFLFMHPTSISLS